MSINDSTNRTTAWNIIQSTSPNPPEDVCLRSHLYRNAMVTIFIALIGLSVLLNILLWIAFISKKRLRTVVLGYLISLSLSDVITAGSLGWMEVVYIFHYPHWSFGEMGSYVINAFWCFSLATPFTHIVFIAHDRYRAVTSSVLYSEGKSWRRELLKISMLWLYSIAIVLLFAFHFTPAPGFTYQWNVLPEWYYPFLAVHLILPLVICTALYVIMVRHVKLHRENSQKYIRNNPTIREYHFACSVGIIIAFLYLVWIPVVVMESLYATHAHTCVISQLGPVSVWLTCTSGVINPVVVLVRNRKVRDAVFRKKSASAADGLVLANVNAMNDGDRSVRKKSEAIEALQGLDALQCTEDGTFAKEAARKRKLSNSRGTGQRKLLSSRGTSTRKTSNTSNGLSGSKTGRKTGAVMAAHLKEDAQ